MYGIYMYMEQLGATLLMVADMNRLHVFNRLHVLSGMVREINVYSPERLMFNTEF